MSRVSPQIRDLAKQLRAFETPGKASADADNPAVFRAVEKLHSHLSMLMGRSGFQALLARALVLACAEVPWLSAVRVVADGELEALTVAQTTHNAADLSEGEVVLLAELLGLLVAFIGMALTLRLINQIWPQLKFNDADFSNKPDNGDAK